MKQIVKSLALGLCGAAASVMLVSWAGLSSPLPAIDHPVTLFAQPVASVQAPQEPPPLPDGEYCAHLAHDDGPAHACDCHRTCYMDDADPPQEHMQEDPHCKVYCRPTQCRCGIDDQCEVPKR